ncbi:glycerophosphodiester phosphodiesterase family protein [Arenibacterium sp. LLYu02]|uniref:glycerophosphodiester phosphodiesterase family protein n=1 Tax=Arenibacterium sp. LLYu02 TaxID=3404132 RepID=UPI003B219CCA
MSDWLSPARPYVIAHRGASAYAPDGSVEAYEKAARLGADFWEVDIRRAACGTLITYHDAALPDGRAIADLTADEIAEAARQLSVPAVPFATILALAVDLGAGIYADIKDASAALPVMQALKAHGITRAILGAFDPMAVAALEAAQCPYPRAALVPVGADPFEHAKGADIIHLCWESLERPQDLLTPAFFACAERLGQKIVLWHEEDPARMADLRHLPVLGICSDRPEMVHPFDARAYAEIEIVCHRGAPEFAPENTVEGAICAFGAGFDVVELDVHSLRDGVLAVIHDDSFERTTDGRGMVAWSTSEAVAKLDAGAWYAPQYRGTKVPSLDDLLDVTKTYGGKLYVELKKADPSAVLAAVRAKGLMEQCFFWAFDYQRLAALRAEAPEAQIMIRRQDLPDLDTALATLRPAVLEFTAEEDFSVFARCRAAGARPMIAYMGREPKVFDKILSAAPDLANLHFPFLFRDHLRARQS